MLKIISKHQSYTFKVLLIEQISNVSQGNCKLQIKSKRVSWLNQNSYYVWKNTFWSTQMFCRHMQEWLFPIPEWGTDSSLQWKAHS